MLPSISQLFRILEVVHMYLLVASHPGTFNFQSLTASAALRSLSEPHVLISLKLLRFFQSCRFFKGQYSLMFPYNLVLAFL